MNHPSEETLNDYVDELLPETERQDVRRHLDGCADCKRTVAELGQIVRAAAALGEVEPARDLLPGIRLAVSPETGSRRGWMRWVAAAAVVGFVALLAVMRVGNDETPALEALLADFRAAEAEYVKATEMLARGIEERRDEIEPETLELLEANLALIDSAIAEVHVALDRNGVGVENTHMLNALYNKKLDILMRASRLSS